MASAERKRPPKPTSTNPTPGGDTVTTAQDIEAGEPEVVDHRSVTEPVDVEQGSERGAEPDDAARTEPADVEPPDREPPSGNG